MSSAAESVAPGSCRITEFPPVKIDARDERLDNEWEQMEPVIFDASPAKVFELWPADEGRANQIKYMESSGDKDCKVPHWELSEDNVLARELSTSHKLGALGTLFGSPYSTVTSEQKLYRISADHFILRATLRSKGFSLGETFELHGDEEYTLVPPDAKHDYPRCKYQQSFCIRFVRWTLLKPALRIAVASESRATNKGVSDFILQLVADDNQAVAGSS